MENIKLEKGEKLVNVYFIGAKRVPNKKEYYELDLLTCNNEKRAEKNNAYTLLKFYPKMESVPQILVPLFTPVRCVFEDVEEGAKPRFRRFVNLEEDIKKFNKTATAVEE